MVSIQIDHDYGYVVLTAAVSLVTTFWTGVRVGGFRKKAGIKYPNAYATQAQIDEAEKTDPRLRLNLYRFNCAQRAHSNLVENFPIVLSSILLGGLTHPCWAASLGIFWNFSRVLYAIGYTKADVNLAGKYRQIGGGHFIAQIGLIFLTFKTAYHILAQ